MLYFVLPRSPLTQNNWTVCLFNCTGKPKMQVGQSGYRIYQMWDNRY